jgi:hypothetical protein
MSNFRFQNRYPQKVIPALDDRFLVSDSADGGKLKTVAWSTVLAAIGGGGGGGYLGHIATVAGLLASGAEEGQWCVLGGSGTKRIAICIAEPSTVGTSWIVAGYDELNTPPVITETTITMHGANLPRTLGHIGKVMQWSAVGLPAGLSLNPATGQY